MKNPINMTPQELIENGFDRPINTHVTRLDGERIFGAFEIGRLKPTNGDTKGGKPIFLTEKGQFVYCEPEMAKRINERLNLLTGGK